jgi:VWFA-related protein
MPYDTCRPLRCDQRRAHWACGLGLLALPSILATLAAQQPPSSPADARFRSGTTAVVIDVVVRDRNGRPVTTLAKPDFELLEDGELQEINDVTVVAPEAQNPEGRSPATLASVDSASARSETGRRDDAQTSYLAFVFDRLSPEARAFAFKGANAYFDTRSDGDLAAVFVADLSLRTIQPYTPDGDAIRRALEEAATYATSRFTRDDFRDLKLAASQVYGDRHPSVPTVASAESAGRPAQKSTAGSAAEIVAAAAISRSEQLWEEMARDQQGYATTNALMAVVAGMGGLAGRKTVVFFAEGLAIPPAVLPHFQNVVATAARANVAIYCIDAAGLRVHSTDAEIGREVRDIADANLDAVTRTDVGGKPMTATLERNEDVLRKDARTSLSLLAEQTGAFLVSNTNDLAKGFRDINTDRQHYYLLTYRPKNDQFRGEWRNVRVRVRDRQLRVRSRAGYLALATPGNQPVLQHEGPALAAMERAIPPRDLEILAGAFVFPSANAGSPVAIVTSLTAKQLQVDQVAKTRSYAASATVVARIRDEHGVTVRKASQQFALAGPLDQLPSVRDGEIVFTRQPVLPAGKYVLDVAWQDARSNRIAVKSTPFQVPAPHTFDVSSPVVVRRGEPIPKDQVEEENPLAVGSVRLHPNLGESVSRADGAAVLFLMVMSPTGAQSVVGIDIVGAAKRLALPVTLDRPDSQGRIRQLVRLPLADLPNGDYEVQVVATSAGSRVVRQTRMTVVD